MTTRTHSSGPLQADLLGGSAGGPAPVHRLFLALLPDAATRARLAQAAAALKAGQPDLRARWVNPARYHATLHFLGDHVLLRQTVVDAAMTAAGGLRMAPFDWVLHEAASFAGRQPPCILRSTGVPEALQRLWQDLRRALVLAGQGRHVAPNFTPHVTVAYSQGARLDTAPIDPVTWPVESFALVHSVVGQADYQVLAEWPLQGDSAGIQE